MSNPSKWGVATIHHEHAAARHIVAVVHMSPDASFLVCCRHGRLNKPFKCSFCSSSVPGVPALQHGAAAWGTGVPT